MIYLKYSPQFAQADTRLAVIDDNKLEVDGGNL